jgi:8-amino-7-oxononanoate synthase
LRIEENAFRTLKSKSNLTDFSSNDYIGFSQSANIFNATHQYLIENQHIENGATGSRLISGNHKTYQETEVFVANFHESESALIFNSGYDLNVGFFGCVPQRSDVVFFDELCHASIRDGIQLGLAKSYKFRHNDFEHLEQLIQKCKSDHANVYIVTESVFSMDGDTPNLFELNEISEKYNCFLVVDEAHAIGVFGENGHGLLQHLDLHKNVFARIVTFGKALGCHGAAILGSKVLIDYLINFCRSFIYTTGLSPHSVSTILISYKTLHNKPLDIKKLSENILHFNQQKSILGLKPLFVRSKSAIQCAIIPGNEKVKNIAQKLHETGFDVKPILSPTVPAGQERLRICLHSYNTKNEIESLLMNLLKHLT